MRLIIFFTVILSCIDVVLSKPQNDEPLLTEYNINLWRNTIKENNFETKQQIENLIDAYYYLATFYKEINADSALFLAKKSLEFIDENHPKSDKIHSLIGYTYNRIGVYDKAIFHLTEALKFTFKKNKEVINGYLVIDIGNLYYNKKLYKVAAFYYNYAIKLFKKNNQLYGLSVAENNLGLISEKLGDYKKSKQHFLNALFHRLNDKPINDSLVLVHSYIYIANNALFLNEIDSAVKYQNLALTIASRDTASSEYLINVELSALASKANYFVKINQFDSCIYYLDLAIQKAIDKNYKDNIYEYQLLKFEYAKKLNHDKEALSFAKIALKKNNQSVYPEAYIELIEFLIEKNYFVGNEKLSMQNKILKMKVNLLENEGIENMLINVHEILGIVEENISLKEKNDELNDEKHLNNIFLFVMILSSLFSSLLIWLLFKNYRSKKTLQAINLKLKEQSDAIAKHSEDLKTANEIKNILISVLSHDVKSPINSVSGMLELIKDAEKEQDHLMFKEYVGITESVLKKAADLLDELTVWAKDDADLQDGIGIFKIEDIFNDIKNTQQAIILNKKLNIVAVNAGLEIYGDSRTFKMIARNLISNAIKYCPPETNIIEYCTISGNGIEVKIFDEGHALPFTDIETLIQNSSSDLNKKGGLGLKLVYNLIRRTGGKIYFENLEHGKQFVFWLPWKVIK